MMEEDESRLLAEALQNESYGGQPSSSSNLGRSQPISAPVRQADRMQFGRLDGFGENDNAGGDMETDEHAYGGRSNSQIRSNAGPADNRGNETTRQRDMNAAIQASLNDRNEMLTEEE